MRAAYNRAERLGDRRKMMQAWADYLDGLRAGRREWSVSEESVQGANGSAQSENRTQVQNNSRKSRQKRDTAVSQLELFCAPGGK